jgi:serine/threonine protein kinase
VKLLDFGIAVSREDEAFFPMGTKRYMAPEQVLGGQVDHRADLFGVGVILYELICGDSPPGASNGRIQRDDAFPEPLWKTVDRLLANSVDKRPSSAREVQAELEMFLASRGLEGTRAHLADVIDQVAPDRMTPLRVLSRITQMTNLTRAFTRAEDPSVELKKRSKAPFVFAGLLAAGVGAVLFAATAEPEQQTPLAIAPPIEPIRPPPVATPTIAAEIPEEPIPEKPEKPRPKKRAMKIAKSGWLTIDTRPWTEVYVGKRRLGLTPVVGAKLSTGKHELTLKNEKLGLIRKITVTIRSGKTLRIQRTL